MVHKKVILSHFKAGHNPDQSGPSSSQEYFGKVCQVSIMTKNILSFQIRLQFSFRGKNSFCKASMIGLLWLK